MWRLLDHTADLAIEGSGAGGEEALAGLCEGLINQLTEVEKVRVARVRSFSASGVDLEDAIVTAVGELVFAAQAERWLPASVEKVTIEGFDVEIVCSGGEFDPAVNTLEEIKAATFHDFFFGQEGGPAGGPVGNRWVARMVFDV